MTLLPQLERDLEAAARRQLSPEGAPPRRPRPRPPAWLAPVAAVLVVLAVVGVFLGLRGRQGGGSPASAGTGQTISFTALPLSPTGVSTSVIARTESILRTRLHGLVPGATVSARGDVITVRMPGSGANVRGEVAALSAPGALRFYDWEGDALMPDGRTVASGLHTDNPTALTISQGNGPIMPGSAAAGGLSLYQAVRLAGRQPALPGVAHYYLFAAVGQGNCVLGPGRAQAHCLIAGPAASLGALTANLTPYEHYHLRLEALPVPPGYTVVQAAPASFSLVDTQPIDEFGRFFVLRDQGFAIPRLDATASTDMSGRPDVVFSFPSAAARRFQTLTATVARRGQLVSSLGQTLDQHFAVALGDRLITVPYIDFRPYPDGIDGSNGADISGGFTTQTARELATILRSGPLPVTLVPR